MKRLLRSFAALVAGILLMPAAAQAQTSQLLNLTLPPGPGPHPAVLLLHGCSGILENQQMWQNFLRERGYASANLDSFTPRRIPEICTDFRRLPMHDRVNDAYEALVQLAARSDIDRQRIAVMGFSNGGVATLAVLTSVVGSQLVPGSPRFRAGVALYPDCSLTSPRFYAPILVLIGALDDWTPAAECTELQGKIGPDRPAFFTSILSNAHHAFDVVNQPLHYMGNARNIHRRGGLGATVGGSWPATETAKKEIEAFLGRELLNRPGSREGPNS